MLQRIFDYFIFTSLFIAGCAMLLVYQVHDIFDLKNLSGSYLWFVFFSTICSYNFHWYFTPNTVSENRRTIWTQQHKGIHLFLIVVSLVAAGVFFLPLIEFWFWIGISILLTFLYSAPKIPFRAANFLKKIAIGKTIFLALVWMYVTSILPVILAGNDWPPYLILFCISRFFLFYAICIIFDFRDREQDKQDGIKSLITFFNETGINIIFYSSIFVFLLTTVLLHIYDFSMLMIIVLLLPAFIVLGLYQYSKKNFSDYLYYFFLDGMMALSALLTSLLPF